MKVIYRHPALDQEELVAYVRDGVPPASARGITSGLEHIGPMWRAVSDYRRAENRVTSWASTREQAEMFGWPAIAEFRQVKKRERATVIAIVLHDPEWLEYVVIDDDDEETNR